MCTSYTRKNKNIKGISTINGYTEIKSKSVCRQYVNSSLEILETFTKLSGLRPKTKENRGLMDRLRYDEQQKVMSRKRPLMAKHQDVSSVWLSIVAPCKIIHEGPGFRIPASGFWIPTLWIPDSNLLDSGFQTIVDSGFQDSNSKNLLDSGFSYMG